MKKEIIVLWLDVFGFCVLRKAEAMEMEQELEWKKAQKTVINVDLVAAAKRQLEFLAAVDRNRWLYEGPAIDIAIYRQ